ncbi:phage regulatory CII family protein [Pectobacterium aquaticum]|uniref:phage regulatory CII family protein n=1 Tax=Pectobacterium aquaticum TaxID=2204145 RepID=UPI000E251BCE|nr:phage regulatory CII family protein [Pectobacterium aquaticum]UEM40056.1 phage regulatory CII family protein [Pectobacterium aquaticum]
MFDYQIAKHPHFDAACRAFALAHNLEAVAAAIGVRSQVLRNKLNPEQPHRLTCCELLAITDHTEDATLLDGLLAQINCLPSVPRNEAKSHNVTMFALSATADVGAIAGEAVSSAPMSQARKNAILNRANSAIRNLSLIVLSVESRFQSTPMMAAAVDVLNSAMPVFA